MLQNLCKELFSFVSHAAAIRRYEIGPVLGEESATNIRYLVDPRVVTGTRWVTGANVDGQHVIDLVEVFSYNGSVHLVLERSRRLHQRALRSAVRPRPNRGRAAAA